MVRARGWRNLSLLWETLHPDKFLVDHEPMYLWLTRFWVYYVKKFYPAGIKFETDPADGAKTRDLIRQHVDVEELKRNMPTYVLDADYLTKIKDNPPDSKALDIEAMLASELQLRIGEDEEFQPLSERLLEFLHFPSGMFLATDTPHATETGRSTYCVLTDRRKYVILFLSPYSGALHER